MAPADVTFRLLNETQRDFPLEPRPFARIGSRLGLSEAQVLRRVARLQADGLISRLGAVVAPNSLGASTLAALRVPARRLEEVAALVSAREEVNHNYEREHPVNLWFVAAAPSRARLASALREIEAAAGLPVLDLRLEAEYHIDLGFDLRRDARAPKHRHAQRDGRAAAAGVEARDRRVLCAIEDGLPLCPRPYAEVAAACGLDEAEVIGRLARLLAAGLIKRLGLIVRHHELGFRANAMAVWDVPDDDADALGRALAARAAVTLCYRRTRRPPAWPYNLHCMIHGRARDEVLARLAALNRDHGLAHRPRAVLFSRRRFKQRGARYGPARAAADARGAA